MLGWDVFLLGLHRCHGCLNVVGLCLQSLRLRKRFRLAEDVFLLRRTVKQDLKGSPFKV